MGTLSLALRPLAESAGELEEAIASGDVDVPANGADEKKMLAAAAARPTASRASATTGGDVSSFWVQVSGRVSAPPHPTHYDAASGASGVRYAGVPPGRVVRVHRGGADPADPG